MIYRALLEEDFEKTASRSARVSLRAGAYTIVFATLVWATLADFLEEDRTRRLPAKE